MKGIQPVSTFIYLSNFYILDASQISPFFSSRHYSHFTDAIMMLKSLHSVRLISISVCTVQFIHNLQMKFYSKAIILFSMFVKMDHYIVIQFTGIFYSKLSNKGTTFCFILYSSHCVLGTSMCHSDENQRSLKSTHWIWSLACI